MREKWPKIYKKRVNFLKPLLIEAAPGPAIHVHARRIKVNNMAEISDNELRALLPVISLKNEEPRTQVWLTQKDALAFARTVLKEMQKRNSIQDQSI